MVNSKCSNSKLYAVARREWGRMTSRRLYLGTCVVLPLFCLVFMATIFGSGQMEEIPVGVVDMDYTAASRSIVRRIAAVPTFRVTERFADEAAARRSLQRKEIYGYLVIPPQFGQRMVTGKDARLAYYYHYALLSVGSEVMAAFENALAPVAVSPIVMTAEESGVSGEQVQTLLLPVKQDTHPLYNPDMNYSIYLSQPFFFVLFQILILLVTVYSIGHEVKRGTASEWLRTAGGDILVAVAGKLLPYTFIYMLTGVAANSVLFGLAHIPLTGSLWLLNGVTLLFIVATQALAVFLFALFPRIAYVISAVSMTGSLGATLCGVTFPVTAMYAPVHAASYLFPVRHFTEAAQALIYFGAGFGYIWQPVAALLLFLLAAVAALPRIAKAPLNPPKGGTSEVGSQKTEDRSSPLGGVEGAAGGAFGRVIRREWHAVSTNPAILLVLAGGIFLYGLLYNYMYAPDLVRKAPVAVVDCSRSALSRRFVRMLDATPQTAVTHRTPDILEARRWMAQGDVTGILYLPADFETRVMRGETSVYPLYASTDAFLHFKGLNESCSRVMLALNSPAALPDLPTLSAPVGVSGTALYNYTEGYGSYLIPAVLIVIIFQTMLMLISMRMGEEREKLQVTNHKLQESGTLRFQLSVFHLIGRSLVYVALYGVFSLFLLGLLPHLFSIPHIGRPWDIVAMMVPFLFATSFMAQAASRRFTDAEAPLLMIAFFSVGYIFLSGVSYPLELMPWYWRAAHYLFPVCPAVLAFVKLNSMGATLADVLPQVAVLWMQVLVYGVLAVGAYYKKKRLSSQTAFPPFVTLLTLNLIL